MIYRAVRKVSTAVRPGKKRASGPAQDSREEILAVATQEFAQRGLSGARVDEIAARTRTSKRMIYYYFSGKEGLYRAVLERVYSEIRQVESQLDLDGLAPQAAIARIVELTFDYDESHPEFITLVNVENINRGKSIGKLSSVHKRYAHILSVMARVLERGVASGVFRPDVTPIDVRLVIAALCYFRVSNRYTFGALFDCNLAEPAVRARHRRMIVDAVQRFLKV
ncbi:MAG: TetR family transcriptional regulator [Gammaproteobacteria bacterium]|nr:TetR family transcriptional regulator [Gammaproteobacteria bacterium]